MDERGVHWQGTPVAAGNPHSIGRPKIPNFQPHASELYARIGGPGSIQRLLRDCVQALSFGSATFVSTPHPTWVGGGSAFAVSPNPAVARHADQTRGASGKRLRADETGPEPDDWSDRLPRTASPTPTTEPISVVDVEESLASGGGPMPDEERDCMPSHKRFHPAGALQYAIHHKSVTRISFPLRGTGGPASGMLYERTQEHFLAVSAQSHLGSSSSLFKARSLEAVGSARSLPKSTCRDVRHPPNGSDHPRTSRSSLRRATRRRLH